MKPLISGFTLIVILSASVMFSACHKAQVASTVPSPPPPAPKASLTASQQAIEKGQAITLTWETANANDVSIDAVGLTTKTLGLLEPYGSLRVTPSDSTTYTLYAKGPGGQQSASARVTVTQPAPPPAPSSELNEDELFSRTVKDVYFDFDSWEVRSDQQSVIERDAAFLTQHPTISFTVEGNCDERGSTEYNLALGDRRANAVKVKLVAAGTSSANIETMSYGKEKPVCTEHDDACWQQNRHDHFNR